MVLLTCSRFSANSFHPECQQARFHRGLLGIMKRKCVLTERVAAWKCRKDLRKLKEGNVNWQQAPREFRLKVNQKLLFKKLGIFCIIQWTQAAHSSAASSKHLSSKPTNQSLPNSTKHIHYSHPSASTHASKCPLNHVSLAIAAVCLPEDDGN